MKIQNLFRTLITGIDAHFYNEETPVFIERDGILKPVQGAIATSHKGVSIVILHSDDTMPGLIAGQLVAQSEGEGFERG